MLAMFPFVIILLIVIAVYLFRNVFVKLSPRIHYVILLTYLIVLIAVASYFFLSINQSFKALEKFVDDEELVYWDESQYDMIEYDEYDRVIVKGFPSGFLKEKETVKGTDNRFEIATNRTFGELSEWDLVIVIEEVASINGEVIYSRYETPTILEYNGAYYDVTDDTQRISITKAVNGITLERENSDNTLWINSLSSSLLLTQFKRDDKEWWHSVDSYNYGTTSGPTVLRISVPKGMELDIAPILKQFIVKQ